MADQFVVVADNHLGRRVFGPYDTAAKASGRGFELFGPLTFGCPTKWCVLPMTPDQSPGDTS